MKCWIQKSDYSTEGCDNVSSDEAVRMFQQFDWKSEIALYEPDSNGKRDCSPGMGITNSMNLTQPGSRLVHVCPIDDKTCLVNHHTTSARRILGILPPWQVVKDHRGFPIADVPQLIRLFFDGREREILERR